MRAKIKLFIEKPFVRNVIILTSGTAAAQFIVMMLSPIITRLYGPEAYGVMGTFTAIISTLGPVIALTFPIAIVLPKRDKEAKELMKLSIYLSVFFSLAIAIVLMLFSDYIINIFHLESISAYLYLIPLALLFSGLYQVIEQWFIRTKQFAVSAKVTFIQAVIVNGGKIGVGLVSPYASVLIIFSVISQGLRMFLMLFLSKNKKESLFSGSIKSNLSNKEVFKKYKDFPIFRAPQVFLNAMSQNLPILMLTSFFGPISAGFYSIGRTVLTLPSTLIGKSVGDVFYPRISEASNNNENLTKLIKNATLALSLVGVIPYGLVFLFGPWLFGFVFGSDWVMAGEYARWVSLWIFFMFINQPSVKALPVIGAQSFHLKFTIITLIVRFSLLAIGYFIFNSDLVSIALFGISGAILNLSLILMTLKRSTKFNRED